MRLPLTLILILACSTAQAQRMSTTAMDCDQARGLVARSGGIVLGTGGPTYDRFVGDRSACAPTEVTRSAFAPTRNQPRCFIGYTCIEPGPDDWFGDR